MFSSINFGTLIAGSSVSESATGAKEVVIQGDVMFELPALLMNEFKVVAKILISVRISTFNINHFSLLDCRISDFLCG